MSIVDFITFQNGATAVGNGKEYAINYDVDDIVLEITGTSTSRTIVFEGKGFSGAWYPVTCVNLNGYTMATQTTGNNCKAQVILNIFRKIILNT